jgi:AraC-like DNA-binding protein
MDPLSDVLSLLKLDGYWCSGFDFGGDWSIELPAQDGIKFYAAVKGTCLVAVDGVADPVRVVAGDCVVLPRGRGFRVATDLALPPVNPLVVFADDKNRDVSTLNGGGDFFCIGGQFAIDGAYADDLLALLPPIMLIRNEHDKSELRWCVERLRQEMREPRPGGFLVAQQLTTLVLIAALRLHIEHNGGVGWLFALSDPPMAAAIAAIHDDPSHDWTVATLAEHAGMSRTTFTIAFKRSVGLAPIEYLTRWRMRLAGDRLVASDAPITEIAESLGYGSESAFSTAFKRVMGTSPRRYATRRSTR